MTINPQKSCLTTIFFNYGKETKKYFRLIREKTALVNEEARLWIHQKNTTWDIISIVNQEQRIEHGRGAEHLER